MQNIQKIYLFCMFYMDIQNLSCFRYWEIRRLGGLEKTSKVSITPRLPTAKAIRDITRKLQVRSLSMSNR